MNEVPPVAVTCREVTCAADWEAAKAVRFAVFCDEQGFSPSEELDEHDATARHWVAVSPAGGVLGTARAVTLPGGAWKVGRVAVARDARGQGVGAALMRAILASAGAAGVGETLLDSQVQAMGFYARLGYLAEGPEFLEAGCPHRRMRRLVTA